MFWNDGKFATMMTWIKTWAKSRGLGMVNSTEEVGDNDAQ
jgi:hypothetical protein